MRRICFILNPAAGGGRGKARLAALERAASRHLEDYAVCLTEGPGHASHMAREAALGDWDLVAAVGGDGTAHEVVNGLFEHGQPVREGIGFGLVHVGTGGDLRRSLGVPRSMARAVQGLGAWPLRRMDVMDVRLTPLEGGAPVRRVCVNVAGLGMNGRVVQRVNASGKRLGPTLTFGLATVQTVLQERPEAVRLEWTDRSGTQHGWAGSLMAAFIANGGWCGGGMWVGRGGAIDDGLVDALLIPEMPMIRLVLGSPRLFTGTAHRVKEVSRAQMRTMIAFAESGNAVLVDLDGELSGKLPLELSVTEEALLVAAQWGGHHGALTIDGPSQS